MVTTTMMTITMMTMTMTAMTIMTTTMKMVTMIVEPGHSRRLWVGDSFTTGKVESSIPSDNAHDDDDDFDDDGDNDDDDYDGDDVYEDVAYSIMRIFRRGDVVASLTISLLIQVRTAMI